MNATATRPAPTVELVARETSPRVGGSLLIGGKPYRYYSELGGYALENVESGAVYHVATWGGKPAGCDCGDAKFRGSFCKHQRAAVAALAAW